MRAHVQPGGHVQVAKTQPSVQYTSYSLETRIENLHENLHMCVYVHMYI
jgi:hypothetical protein